MRNRNSIQIIFIALLTMLIIGCIAIAGINFYEDSIKETNNKESKNRAEPLVINTYPKVSNGKLTVIDHEQGVVFQYDGEIQIHYSESEKKTYVNVYIDYPDWAYK